MAALWNRAGHYIFALWFLLLSFYLLLFLAYSQPSQIVCLPYFHTWCGLSANLRRRSETCCTRLAENTGSKKSSKIRHLGTITQLCRAICLQLKHTYRQSEKSVKQQCLPHMSSQYGKLRPLTAEIVSVIWGTPHNVNRFRALAALLHGTGRQPNIAALNRGRHIRQAGHHVGHLPTFVVTFIFASLDFY